LPDGTKVWLNAGSRLSYDSGTYNKDKRSVSLSGEAFFDVTKNKERPFIIRTNRICIKVLGTAFNVKAYPEDKITETTLLRGSIELTVNNKPCRKIMLRPNEKFLLIDDLPGDAERKKVALTRQQPSGSAGKTRLVIQDIQPVLVANKEYVEEISWMNNDLVFENESLEELAPRMERWFNVTIEINDASLKSLHFTGVFHKETIGEALSAMQLIKPFTYQINQNHVHIN
jgi:ferric-dicitrate binding protein FerR (iron transport regulator)